MNSLFYATLAGTLAVSLEYLFKRGWSWEGNLWLFVPGALLMNWLIYKLLVSGGSTWIVALAAFTLVTLLARAALSQFVIHEPLIKGNLAAAGLLIAAQVVGRVWR